MRPLPQLAAFRALATRRLGLTLRFDMHLQRAFEGAAHLLGTTSVDAVCGQLAELPWTAPAWQAVIEAVTIRETSFFRHTHWWDSLTAAALAPLVAARRRDGSRRLRCLSIGCASGEEPYSLAMILDRLVGPEPGWRVEIIGVDLCASALDAARAGRFDARSVREMPAVERARWLRRDGNNFSVDEELRRRVDFRLFNIAEALTTGAPGPGAPADFLLCRNVLIHMEAWLQPLLASHLVGLLAPGGMLAVAPVEATAAWFAPLKFQPAGNAILFSRVAPAARSLSGATAAVDALTEDRPARKLPAAPLRTEDALERARHLADLGLFEEARSLCAEALAAQPEAGLLMALVCQALGDVPAAERAAKRALAAAPSSATAQYVLAIVKLRKGDTGRARSALGEAVRLLGTGDDLDAAAAPLGIEAGHIRQAARRLGAAGEEGRHV
ncbi:CheR family methyltransferase [Xanthobacter sp. KR7-65]|uniref:CheR family methyltransferase n=1 Tax=Xanthobacter sp. KR7-65 TaxID=3156612 RepID=UPI0032B474B9